MQGRRVTGVRQGGVGEEEQTLHLKVVTAIEMERRLFRPGLCPLLLHFMKSEVCGNGIPMPLLNPITSRAFNVAVLPSLCLFCCCCCVVLFLISFLFYLQIRN